MSALFVFAVLVEYTAVLVLMQEENNVDEEDKTETEFEERKVRKKNS